MVDARDGKITKQLLKTRSGEFDLESIHSLCLRNLGISDLTCISECTTLEKLDLSNNELTKLHKLAGLVNLANLNLSVNQISSIEGLQALENLYSLNLSGNLIPSVDALRCLTGLEKLREIRMKDKIKGIGNPACMNRNYRADIMAMFPKLTTLDGERIKGKGRELFDMYHEIDRLLESDMDVLDSVAHKGPWIPDDLIKKDTSKFDNSNLCDAEQQLKDLLDSCSRLVQESEVTLMEMKKS